MSGSRARGARARAVTPGAAAAPAAPHPRPPRPPGAPAPGPLVAVCTGHRCAGLRRLAGGQVLDEGLRAAVRTSPGGVLLSCPCLGRCEQGPVTAVGHHDAGAGEARQGQGCSPAPHSSMVWLREPPDPAWRTALQAWVSTGATPEASVTGAVPARSLAGIPGPLRETVVGFSAGSSLRHLPKTPTDTPGAPPSA